jgi:hypothetical protein
MDLAKKKISDREHILAVEFVDPEYFLGRICSFERKYGMGWGEFLAKYSNGDFGDEECRNSDFAEWAFLCNNFMTELISHDHGGPPGNAANPDIEKPEGDSGFFILGRRCCSTSRNTSNRLTVSYVPVR